MAKKQNFADVDTGKFFDHKLTGYSCGYGFIDRISGVPGILFPNAVAVELYGQKSSGKTTLVLETIAYNQLINDKFKVLYMDYEKMLRAEIPYLESLGITVNDDRIIIKDDMVTAEEGMNFMSDFIQQEKIDMIVVDTVAAMCPKAEIENKVGESKQMGLRAKLMNEFLRRFFAVCPPDGPALIFLNQQYEDMQSMSYVKTYHTPSSVGLSYYAGIKICLKEKAKVKRDIVDPYTFEKIPQPYGSIINVKTEKNKVGRPFISTNYFITYGQGIDVVPSIVQAAIATKHIKKGTGGMFSYINANGAEVKVRGEANFYDHLRTNLDDLVFIGSSINDLWKNDMVHLKARLEAKHPLQDSMYSDMYSVDDSSDFVSADLMETIDDAPSTGGTVNLGALESDAPVEVTLDDGDDGDGDGLKIL